MAFISITYDLPLPNEYLVDHSFSQGKTREATYNGPDKVYLQINKETHKEMYGPLTIEDLSDGRPIPADCYLLEVDALEYPLICQLRGAIMNETQEDFTHSVPHPQSPIVEGYPRYTYGVPLKPQDIFNRFSVRVENGVPKIDAFTVAQRLADRNTLVDWIDLREKRDKELEQSDGQVSEDMPQNVKDEFIAYRQLLRNFPQAMEAANVPAHIAYYMFPEHPHSKKTPR
jgi:hypothetical protein